MKDMRIHVKANTKTPLKTNVTSPQYDLIVIGGGASGMMAAGVAASRGKKVLLLEKNRALGEKLRITGGGRCNITNAEKDIHRLLAHYGEGAPFLFSPFSQFGVEDTFTFFESKKLPVVTQANNRAFPKTEKAPDVVKTLVSYMNEVGVTVLTNSPVQKILSTKNQKAGPGSIEGGVHIDGVMVSGVRYEAKNYLLATGGMSHPETGSTGDGFSWLRELGHSVQAPTPTIVPLATAEEWGHLLSGTSVEDIKITFYVDEVKSFSKTGKLLFTHFGLSGPMILNSAGKVSDLMHQGVVTAKIDLFPLLNIGALDAHITKIFDEHKNKALKNVLKEIVPPGTAVGVAYLLEKNMSHLLLETKVHSVTKTERRALVDTLKALMVTITHLMDYDRAVVADGGIALSEIDTKTMRSKRCDNLFVTGDLLHIKRPSGGFSLQLCWTTGFVAGSSV